ncbi:hypothetical protein SDC9_65350 [bioreactor metagenome]|uniref:Uncharacterized protein n=1 Tax=bioreactor metagenome TaxID=1076179 RepID=A0A644XRS0_9ZZZZ
MLDTPHYLVDEGLGDIGCQAPDDPRVSPLHARSIPGRHIPKLLYRLKHLLSGSFSDRTLAVEGMRNRSRGDPGSLCYIYNCHYFTHMPSSWQSVKPLVAFVTRLLQLPCILLP